MARSERWVASVVTTVGLCCAMVRPTYGERVRAATKLAQAELVERSTCTAYRAGTCANDPRTRFVSSSDGFTWWHGWFDTEGRQIASSRGGCVSRGPDEGTRPTCSEEGATTVDLCPVALREVLVSGVTVIHWPIGPRVMEFGLGQHLVNFGRFKVDLVVGTRVSDFSARVAALDEGHALRPVIEEKVIGPPLPLGAELIGEDFVVEAPDGGRSATRIEIRPRFAFAPDAGS